MAMAASVIKGLSVSTNYSSNGGSSSSRNCPRSTFLNLYCSPWEIYTLGDFRLKQDWNPRAIIRCSSVENYSTKALRAAHQPKNPPFNVLITGSSKGIGYALTKEFLRAGDNVIICSRSDARVKAAVEHLRGEYGDQRVWGTTCDVRDGESVRRLVDFAKNTTGYVDIWRWLKNILLYVKSCGLFFTEFEIFLKSVAEFDLSPILTAMINNAGSNAYSYKPLMETSDDALMEVVTTNTLGTMICCREAIKMMLYQPRGGHVFNIDGAGADGRPTPRFAAYGATKRSLVHLTKSLQAELRMQENKKVMVHNLSPGMVTTDLLMSGTNTKQAKFFINVLAEPPETVAKFLVPRIRAVPGKASMKPTYIRFLNGFKAYSQILLRLLFHARKDRYVPED